MRRSPALPAPDGVDRCAALLLYFDAAREVVARVKYRNARASVGWLAEGMAALVDPATVDVVSWVPTTSARRRRRGFDHGPLLARAVARRLGLPCRSLLRRHPGPPQTGRNLAERRRGPRLDARGIRAAGLRVLLVDDVLTSGATLTAAARALRNSGVAAVHAVTAARTPLKLRAHLTDGESDGPLESPHGGRTTAGRVGRASAVGAVDPT
jgi:predicted amidophosphoribosyltransferase